MAIRTLFAIATHEDIEIDQMDAITAFLQTKIKSSKTV
jgi:hypothetical protein